MTNFVVRFEVLCVLIAGLAFFSLRDPKCAVPSHVNENFRFFSKFDRQTPCLRRNFTNDTLNQPIEVQQTTFGNVLNAD